MKSSCRENKNYRVPGKQQIMQKNVFALVKDVLPFITSFSSCTS